MREVAYHHIQRKISIARVARRTNPFPMSRISKELGISRTPAREAIRQLVSEGLLESVPGRGVVVITLDRDDIRELFEMREALEGLAARTVAGTFALGGGDSRPPLRRCGADLADQGTGGQPETGPGRKTDGAFRGSRSCVSHLHHEACR